MQAHIGKKCHRLIDELSFEATIVAYDEFEGTTIQFDNGSFEGPLHFDQFELIVDEESEPLAIAPCSGISMVPNDVAVIHTLHHENHDDTAVVTIADSRGSKDLVPPKKKAISMDLWLKLVDALSKASSKSLHTRDDENWWEMKANRLSTQKKHLRRYFSGKIQPFTTDAIPNTRTNLDGSFLTSTKGALATWSKAPGVSDLAQAVSPLSFLPLADKCIGCGRWSVHRCSRCNHVFYCSRSCQRKHWPAHKSKCLFELFKPLYRVDMWDVSPLPRELTIGGGESCRDGSIRCEIKLRKSGIISNSSSNSLPGPLKLASATNTATTSSSSISNGEVVSRTHKPAPAANQLLSAPRSIVVNGRTVNVVNYNTPIYVPPVAKPSLPSDTTESTESKPIATTGIVGVHVAPRKTSTSTADLSAASTCNSTSSSRQSASSPTVTIGNEPENDAATVQTHPQTSSITTTTTATSVVNSITAAQSIKRTSAGGVNPSSLYRAGLLSADLLTPSLDSATVQCLPCQTLSTADDTEKKILDIEEQVSNLCNNLGLIEADVRAALLSFSGDADQAAEWCLSNPGIPPPPPLSTTTYGPHLPSDLSSRNDVTNTGTIQDRLSQIRDDASVNVTRSSYASLRQLANKRRQEETRPQNEDDGDEAYSYGQKALKYDRYDMSYLHKVETGHFDGFADGYEGGSDDNEVDTLGGLVDVAARRRTKPSPDGTADSSIYDQSTWRWQGGMAEGESLFIEKDSKSTPEADVSGMGLNDGLVAKDCTSAAESETVFPLRYLAAGFCYYDAETELCGRMCLVNISQEGPTNFDTVILIRPHGTPTNTALVETQFLSLLEYAQWPEGKFTHMIRVPQSSVLSLLRISVTNGSRLTEAIDDLSSELLLLRALALLSFVCPIINHDMQKSSFRLIYQVMAPTTKYVYSFSESPEFSSPVTSKLLKSETRASAIANPPPYTGKRTCTIAKSSAGDLADCTGDLSGPPSYTTDDLADAIAGLSIQPEGSSGTSSSALSETIEPTGKRPGTPIGDRIGNASASAVGFHTPPSKVSRTVATAVEHYDNEPVNESDVALVCEFTGVSADRARDALRATFGDVERAMERVLS